MPRFSPAVALLQVLPQTVVGVPKSDGHDFRGFQAGCRAACCRLLCPAMPTCAAAVPCGCGA
eukprot:8535921-Alexandrium_andersonii.AAC.1